MTAILKNSIFISLGVFILAACSSGGGGGSSAATPASAQTLALNGTGGAYGIWSGPLLVQPQGTGALMNYFAQEGQCAYGGCAYAPQRLALTISTAPNYGCPVIGVPGQMPGKIFISLRSFANSVIGPVVKGCKRAISNSQGGITVNIFPRSYQNFAGAPGMQNVALSGQVPGAGINGQGGMQIVTSGINGTNMVVSVYVNGLAVAQGTLQNYPVNTMAQRYY